MNEGKSRDSRKQAQVSGHEMSLPGHEMRAQPRGHEIGYPDHKMRVRQPVNEMAHPDHERRTQSQSVRLPVFSLFSRCFFVVKLLHYS